MHQKKEEEGGSEHKTTRHAAGEELLGMQPERN